MKTCIQSSFAIFEFFGLTIAMSKGRGESVLAVKSHTSRNCIMVGLWIGPESLLSLTVKPWELICYTALQVGRFQKINQRTNLDNWASKSCNMMRQPKSSIMLRSAYSTFGRDETGKLYSVPSTLKSTCEFNMFTLLTQCMMRWARMQRLTHSEDHKNLESSKMLGGYCFGLQTGFIIQKSCSFLKTSWSCLESQNWGI